ncbi:plastocyanin [Halomonas campisalis]|uniref:Plastocyanin n=1 Tax=Billgrantia campisalis TaxID=74661 RepID=A0ABS9P5X0_9GAMM|nr:plastocyanin/azurin family copper-binding protein [Halomonas campisalis]MCG6656834.1 plastocyanin [Halomonas campisalis]MDR5862023.1 plastocyanin/azurin family copper-binding protein [Halomonas campisalis]
MRKRLLTLGVSLLATLLIGGAAQAGSEKDANGAADDDVVVVDMVNNEFVPMELEVTVGTTVRWLNVERRSNHDIYFPEEDIASGRLFPEESWERTFDEAGTYEYYCQPHENRGMHGVIRVVEASEDE